MGKQKPISLPDAYQFFDNSFGHVVSFEDICADPDSYSSVFCEGSVALRTLLRDLWENGVETRGCCKGHERVHYYVKKPLFGASQYVDEETYRAHAGSKRYHDIEAEAHAYLAFRPGKLGSSQDICSRIEAQMKALLPELPYATNAYPNLITIGLGEYVPKQQREQFFTTLSFVMHRDFLHDKEIVCESDSPPIKPNLDAKIQSASSRAATARSTDILQPQKTTLEH